MVPPLGLGGGGTPLPKLVGTLGPVLQLQERGGVAGRCPNDSLRGWTEVLGFRHGGGKRKTLKGRSSVRGEDQKCNLGCKMPNQNVSIPLFFESGHNSEFVGQVFCTGLKNDPPPGVGIDDLKGTLPGFSSCLLPTLPVSHNLDGPREKGSG